MPKTVAIIQARMGSTRLPGKVLLPLAGKPMLWHVVQRVAAAQRVDEAMVATTRARSDEPIVSMCAAAGIRCFRGSEDDVLDRYRAAMDEVDADPVIRVTADCPLVDPDIIDELLTVFAHGGVDHVGALAGSGGRAVGLPAFPEGAGATCIGGSALQRMWELATAGEDREHVVTYAVRHPEQFTSAYVVPRVDYGRHRWTVDTADDLKMMERLYDRLYEEGTIVSPEDVLSMLEHESGISEINATMLGREKYRHIWDELDATEQNAVWMEWPPSRSLADIGSTE